MHPRDQKSSEMKSRTKSIDGIKHLKICEISERLRENVFLTKAHLEVCKTWKNEFQVIVNI